MIRIDPSKPIGKKSVLGVLAGGITVIVLVWILQASGGVAMFYLLLGLVGGLYAGRIIEAQVHYIQDGEGQEQVALVLTEEAGQPTSEDLQDKDNCLRILMAVFGLVMMLALIAFMLTGNLG